MALRESFSCVLDNANSPYPGRCHTPTTPDVSDTIPQTPQPSLCSPSSTVDDSDPENNIVMLQHSSPGRVLEHYIQQFDSFSDDADVASSQADIQTTNSVRCSTQDNQWPVLSARFTHQRVLCTPGILSSTPLSYIHNSHNAPHLPSSHNGDRRPFSSDEIVEETIFYVSSDKISSSAPSLLVKTLSQRPNVPRTPSTQPTTQGIIFDPSHGFNYQSLVIRPPEPAVASAHILADQMITMPLYELARDFNLDKKFRPQSHTRPLRPFERGYWQIDCEPWAERRKLECWVFLANYVGMGKAGWGVWCSRDENFQSVRIYCWGEIVLYVYLLLYVSSQREVLYTGASWYDGDHNEVIVMGAR
ncbi:hypothetical protein HD806DRAFT_547025 [Xylariaceae sp. AK1471]|nr:hypothetical protein HD806DRAFT_547025 [Xylariaceae sp. AK1471]